MEILYPVPGFYFQVKICTSSYSFKEVSGIEVDIDHEEITSGGENGFKYKAYSQPKYHDLELKKGFIPRDSLLGQFFETSNYIPGNTPMADILKTHPLIVHLLEDETNPSFSWAFYNPMPIGWSVGHLDALENSYLMESIKFSYDYFEPI